MSRPSRPKWSAAEDAIIKAEYATELVSVIAEKTGRTEAAVWNRAQFLGLRKEHPAKFKRGNVPKNKGKSRTDGRFPLMLKVEALLQAHPEGLTQKEIAEHIGCLESSVSYAIQIMRREGFSGARIDRWVFQPPRHWVGKYVIGHGIDAVKPMKERPEVEPEPDPYEIVPIPRPKHFLWGQCIAAEAA